MADALGFACGAEILTASMPSSISWETWVCAAHGRWHRAKIHSWKEEGIVIRLAQAALDVDFEQRAEIA